MTLEGGDGGSGSDSLGVLSATGGDAVAEVVFVGRALNYDKRYITLHNQNIAYVRN